MSKNAQQQSIQPTTPWSLAVMLLTRWIENNERVDALLESLPRTVVGTERGRCQSLLFGAVRHMGRIEAHLSGLLSRAPRPRLKAILLVAGYELIEGGDEHHAARVVHHAVEQSKTLASEAEARMVNAVVRKVAAAIATETPPPKLASSAQLAAYYSHPEWMVSRWLAQFGAADTRTFLEWNQRPAPVYARWRAKAGAQSAPTEEQLQWLTPTQWPGFYEVKQGNWPQVEAAIAAGLLYLQDPSTRMAIELLQPKAGETILDACAAPGGKSVALADALHADCAVTDVAQGGTAAVGSRLVAMDLPGSRVDRLKENLSRVPAGIDVALVQADLLKVGTRLFADHGLPAEYAAVLVDAPCSNTGVMRHRVDVKWRLQPNDFAKHARQQLALLNSASRRVAEHGRLVYSTCSVDAEENENVISAFLEKCHGRFVLESSAHSQPWVTGHDGAGVFLLRRK